MVITEEVKAVVEASAFRVLDTICADGSPHPIITGSGTIKGDTIVFGIYKMEVTQKNLASNPKAWVVAGTKDGAPKGYRLSGTATVDGKQLIFTAESVEALI